MSTPFDKKPNRDPLKPNALPPPPPPKPMPPKPMPPKPMPPKPMPPKPMPPMPLKPTYPAPPKPMPMPPMPLKPTYPAPPKPMPMPPMRARDDELMKKQAAAVAEFMKNNTAPPGSMAPNPGAMAPNKPNYDGPAYEPNARFMPVPVNPNPPQYFKKGGKVKSSSASNRGDGIAQRGKTKGRFV